MAQASTTASAACDGPRWRITAAAMASAAPLSSISFPKIEPSRNMKNQFVTKPVKPPM